MFFSWKKKYKVAQEQAEVWRKIAAGRDERIEELLRQIKDLYNKRADMYNYCYELKRDKDELLARVKELEAKLDFAIKQRDYYYDLLENASDAYEEGKAISREAE